MRTYSFLLILVLYMNWTVKSDLSSMIQVSGIILDDSTGEPMSFANITYGNQGTTSNLEGHFVLSIDQEIPNAEIQIKYIGYETETINLENGIVNLVVQMKQKTQLLDGVTVYSATDVMNDVVAHHQINYEYQNQLLLTYYKEHLFANDEIYYLAEGVFDVYLPTIYSNHGTLISARKTRKKEFRSLDQRYVPMITGHVSDMVQGSTRRANSFLDPKCFSNYTYSKEGLTSYDGHEVFDVRFEPANKKGTARGTLYIDSESYAIIKAEYYPVVGNQDFWTQVKWVEEYKEIESSWYLHRVSYSGEWQMQEEDYSYEALMVVTDFEEMDYEPELNNVLHDEAIFFHEASVFSEDFWEGNTHMKLNNKETELFSMMEAK